MNQSLSNYFKGIGAKRLSSVEINPKTSNQHEFNGINEFRSIFGDNKKSFHGKFIYLTDDPEDNLVEEGTLTWYDARENHPTRTEFRLYYSSNSVIRTATEGDLLVIGKTGDDKLVIIIISEGSTSEQQTKWLFGLEEVKTKFVVKNFASNDRELNFAGKLIVETLGIEIIETAPDYLEILLTKFGAQFPKTVDFSAFARETLLKDTSPIEEPDKALIAWLEREELLFKTLEKHIVSERLGQGFGADGKDVDEFVSFSLSVHNRRKSRAGHSFENHLAALFNENSINYSKGQKTERNNKPDFLFPGVNEYHDTGFDQALLTMLGVKTTAKDRWRQVLSEADRIPNKHLITLQPSITENQTEEMRSQNLQLVIPAPIFPTYTDSQQKYLISISDFIKLVASRQK